MNRRGFLGRLVGALVAGFAVKCAHERRTPTVTSDAQVWGAPVWETPNGESIVSMHSIGDHLYVFTPSAVYVVGETELSPLK